MERGSATFTSSPLSPLVLSAYLYLSGAYINLSSRFQLSKFDLLHFPSYPKKQLSPQDSKIATMTIIFGAATAPVNPSGTTQILTLDQLWAGLE